MNCLLAIFRFCMYNFLKTADLGERIREQKIMGEIAGIVKERTLKKELTMLMMLVSACTLISACAAVLYVFFPFLSRILRKTLNMC